MPMEATWNPKYSTGIGLIDDQHRTLFATVAQLRVLIQENGDREAIGHLLELLLTTAREHFETEEDFMSRYGYPDLAQHVAEHASMLMGLQDLKAKFEESHQSMAMMVPTFMEGWLRHHISDGDFGFVTFLKARSLV